MYKTFRAWCERLLRIPHEPAPPPGDEASARVFRAAPAFFKYQAVLWCLGTAIMLGVGLAVLTVLNAALLKGADEGHIPRFVQGLVLVLSGAVLLLMAAHACFSLAVLRLNYEKRWYVVTDRSLRIREGVVTVREMTVTFANIQNLSVVQGPIQRALGLSDLKVETAGGGSARPNEQRAGPNLHTAWFRGIDNAEEVRQLIQQRLRALKDSGLGNREEAHANHSPPGDAAFIEALRAVREEARALRAAVA